MNPSTGTFTTMDTYQGSIFDPVSLHKYLYANANPVTYVDPSGYNSADAQSLNVGMTVNAIVDKIVSFADSVVMNIYRGFMAMRTALPAIIAASSSIGLLVVDSPEFADLVSRVANGELSVHSMSLKIQEYILQAQNYSEPVNNAVKNASGSGGSSGSLPPKDPDPNRWKDKIITAGKNFKKHFIEHKKILENHLGKKYPKWKYSNEGEEFLSDIQKLINDGTVKYQGIGTLKANTPDCMIFRGNGMTIVTYLDGEWVTLLESGSGMDLAIIMKYIVGE